MARPYICSVHLCSQACDVLFAALLVLGRRQHVVLVVAFVGLAQVGLGTVVMTSSAEHVPDTGEDHDADGNDRGIVHVNCRNRMYRGPRQDDALKD